MTPETRALVERLTHAGEEMSAAAKRQWDGKPALKISIPARPDYDTDLIVCGAIRDAAAALTALARDLAQTKEAAEVVYASSNANAEEVQRLARHLETARQERDAALATSDGRLRSLLLKGEEARSEWTRAENAIADRDAAVRAARAETWEAAATGLMAGADAGGRRSVTGQVLVNAASKFLSVAAELRAAREGQ